MTPLAYTNVPLKGKGTVVFYSTEVNYIKNIEEAIKKAMRETGISNYEHSFIDFLYRLQADEKFVLSLDITSEDKIKDYSPTMQNMKYGEYFCYLHYSFMNRPMEKIFDYVCELFDNKVSYVMSAKDNNNIFCVNTDYKQKYIEGRYLLVITHENDALLTTTRHYKDKISLMLAICDIIRGIGNNTNNWIPCLSEEDSVEDMENKIRGPIKDMNEFLDVSIIPIAFSVEEALRHRGGENAVE